MRYGDVVDIKLKHIPGEGVVAAKKEGWDIILVDLDYGNGYEEGLTDTLPSVLKQVKNRCPVLVVTSDTRVDTQQRVMEAGASGIVQKPEMDPPAKLHKRLKDAIKKHGRKRKAEQASETFFYINI